MLKHLFKEKSVNDKKTWLSAVVGYGAMACFFVFSGDAILAGQPLPDGIEMVAGVSAAGLYAMGYYGDRALGATARFSKFGAAMASIPLLSLALLGSNELCGGCLGNGLRDGISAFFAPPQP